MGGSLIAMYTGVPAAVALMAVGLIAVAVTRSWNLRSLMQQEQREQVSAGAAS
jgi:hypothetical protein